MIPNNTRIDMPDIIKKISGLGKKIGGFPLSEFWIDIGSPSDFFKAQKDYADISEIMA
ncbi:MAG: hypothetical protein HQM08_21860 [Candidatus Riflebacteria bacterium]|nr:hypothetical protein [Candidatus Riflebacteria bacterium]